MSLRLRKLFPFSKLSQRIVLLELKVENSDLKFGCSMRSDDFSAVGTQFMYFTLALSKSNYLSLYLNSYDLSGLNIVYTAMIYDAKKKPLFGNSSSFSSKDVTCFEMLQGFITFPWICFPLTIICHLVFPALNSETKIISQNADKELTQNQVATKEVVAEANSCGKSPPDCLQELSVDLKKLLNEGIGTDVAILVEDISIKAHKMILRARSPVFDKMFNHDTSEAVQNEIDIKDIRASTMNEFLTFLYTGTTENHAFDDACDLYFAADKYEVISLRDACKKDLLQQLQVENVCQVLILANNHGDEVFKKEVMEYIKNNFKEILATKSFEELAKYDVNLSVELMRNHMFSKSE